MLVEAAVVLCLTNATNVAVSGLVRDGRFKTTSARLEGTSLTYREPLVETPFPAVGARQTGCASIEGLALATPQLVVRRASRRPWSRSPTASVAATRSAARPSRSRPANA